ncbi:hypothetical protein [Yersinia artesiana]|uniref:hypothetical protein n=1 Tax=Yersinia artesiana TaxID=2890315 RepID=UPI001583C42B|nr:hypothetical protein [Yersinia artesiana]
MLEVLKMQPLIKDVDLSDANIMHFTLNGIPAKAINYGHSICIGFVFIEKKMISDSVVNYISLMLVALEDTQDFALQVERDYWWLWYRHTPDERNSIDHERQRLSIALERIHYFIQILNSLEGTMNTPKAHISTKHKIDAHRVVS